VPDPFIINFPALSIDPTMLSRSIELREAVLIGAGGVANGFMWALEELNVTGELHIADPKNVAGSNVNRCLFFRQDDIGKNKARVLAERAVCNSLKLVPSEENFRNIVQRLGRVRRAFSTVDSRRARRSIQNELPLEILDASTTDISEVVVFRYRYPADFACLSCVYEHIAAEDHRERHIADALGITCEEARMPLIDEALARKLASQHAGVEWTDLVGTALDSLFRERCGAGKLLAPAGQQALAPLGFISNLAGVLLALELVRSEAGSSVDGVDANYLALDPWRPPFKQARILKRKKVNCEFCSRLETGQALAQLWKDDHISAENYQHGPDHSRMHF
jgi:hypothetical protein